MMPTFLITLREVIEASLIVATILGILTKLNRADEKKVVWVATAAAILASIVLVGMGSALGFKLQKLYVGRLEEIIEGALMIVSALFITWAVFFLHRYFGKYKTKLLIKITNAVEPTHHTGLFWVVFAAVFREGFEIVLFLTTVYLSTRPELIVGGYLLGIFAGLVTSLAFFWGTIRLPVYWAFRTTSILLILFAAGLLSRGVHEFMEVGFLPTLPHITFWFLPSPATIGGDFMKALFGVTKHMDLLQLSVYLTYVFVMHWWVFVRPKYDRSR